MCYTGDMSEASQSVLSAALNLTEEERAAVVASLIRSHDAGEDSATEIESAWRSEVARRVRELDTGTVKTIPWSEVCRELRGELDHHGR